MSTTTNPIGLVLVGIFSFCLIAGLATAEQHFDLSESQDRLKDLQSEQSSSINGMGMGKLDLGTSVISFPWASQRVLPSGHRVSDSMQLALSGTDSVQRETVLMNHTHSNESVQDLMAANTIKERSLIYDDSQNKDSASQNMVNDQDIAVTGGENEGGMDLESHNGENNNLDQAPDGHGSKSAGNYLNIDVHGISVSALNTVKGGNAVATSNIVIKPVQIIVCAPEVDEKLK
jgi:hypothetical protein